MEILASGRALASHAGGPEFKCQHSIKQNESNMRFSARKSGTASRELASKQFCYPGGCKIRAQVRRLRQGNRRGGDLAGVETCLGGSRDGGTQAEAEPERKGPGLGARGPRFKASGAAPPRHASPAPPTSRRQSASGAVRAPGAEATWPAAGPRREPRAPRCARRALAARSHVSAVRRR